MLSAGGNNSKLPRRGGASASTSSAGGINASPTSSMYQEGPVDDATRHRMRKRDDLIRARAGKDLQTRKRAQNNTAATGPLFVAGRKAKAGTVLFMRPTPPLTVTESSNILQVAQTMAAHRADAVLVVRNPPGPQVNGQQVSPTLTGILTDKDLAFRVVAQNLDVRGTKVEKVMTPYHSSSLIAVNVKPADVAFSNPNCVDPDTPAQEALQKMVDGHFRHLPVTDEDSIYGILDITKCFFQALSKIESAHAKSQALFDALQGVDEEFSHHMGPAPEKLAGFFTNLKEKMASPDLATVLQREGPPPEVSAKTSVRDAVLLMKETKSTAVLVMDPHEHSLAGIFTTKDVCLRVLAQGLDPSTTSIVRVMTPRPDTASEDMTVKDALRKMHDGHYLHLPVVSSFSPTSPVGLVNVLQLTYFALEQMQQLSTSGERNQNASPTQSEGPLWNKFWNSTFEAGSMDDVHSKVDSRAVADDALSSTNGDETGSVTSSKFISASPQHPSMASPAAAAPVPLTPVGYTWKLRDPINNMTYRLSTTEVPSFEHLMQTTASKLLLPGWQKAAEEILTEQAGDGYPFRLVFIDEENDRVEVGGDDDVVDCADFFHQKLGLASGGKCRVALDVSWISIEAAALGRRASGTAIKEEPAVEEPAAMQSSPSEEDVTYSLQQKKSKRLSQRFADDRQGFFVAGGVLACVAAALLILKR